MRPGLLLSHWGGDGVSGRDAFRWRTHRSPEYYVNFRRFALPVSLESAKRRCYKALSKYSQTRPHMDNLRELCIDVYQRHHTRKLAAWCTACLSPLTCKCASLAGLYTFCQLWFGDVNFVWCQWQSSWNCFCASSAFSAQAVAGGLLQGRFDAVFPTVKPVGFECKACLGTAVQLGI